MVMLYVGTTIRNGKGEYQGNGIDVFMDIQRNEFDRLSVHLDYDNHLSIDPKGCEVRLLWTSENETHDDLKFSIAVLLFCSGELLETKTGQINLKLNTIVPPDA